MEEQEPLLKKIARLEEHINPTSDKKNKELKLPRKSKVGKGKLRKGYIAIMKIDDNRNVSFEKQRVEGGTVRLSDGTYHAIGNINNLLFWRGKFPLIIQPVKKRKPYVPYVDPLNGENETKGQKMIMARMLGDTIKIKAKNAASWIVIAAIAIGAIYALTRFLS